VSVLPYSHANLAITVIALACAVVLGWVWYSRPRSRTAFASVALPLLLLCIAWGALFGHAGSPDPRWVRHKPERILLGELNHADRKVRAVALSELGKRLLSGRLSPDRQQALINEALDRQANPNVPWDTSWGQLIESAQAAGKLTPQQWQRYQLQSVTFQLVPTFERQPGSSVPQLDLTVRRGPDRAAPRPTFNSDLAVFVNQIVLDGRPVPSLGAVLAGQRDHGIRGTPRGMTCVGVVTVPTEPGGIQPGAILARVALAATPGAEQKCQATLVVRQARRRVVQEWTGERYGLLPGELRVPLQAKWTLKSPKATDQMPAVDQSTFEKARREALLRRPAPPR